MLEIEADFLSKFIGKYSLGKDGGNGSSHFLRIKIPGGVLNCDSLMEIADLSDEFGRGYAEITDRQDIQLHWIDPDTAIEIFERLYKMGFTTDLCGQAFRETCHGDVRNVVCCPLMGKISPDLGQLVKKINDFFTGNERYITLPHKFKIAITACRNDCVKLFANDLSLFWVGDGFIPLVGGGMGVSLPGVRFAEPMEIKVSLERAFEFVKTVVDIHNEFSNTHSKAKARFKLLVHEWGVEKLRDEIEKRIGAFPETSITREIVKEIGIEHTHGIQSDGNYFFTVPVLGGILDSDKLRLVAGLSKDYGNGEIRLTLWQNITFVDIEDVETLKAELGKHFNLEIPHRAVGCPSDFCGKTLVHSKQIVKDIIHNLASDLSVAVSGCVNGCACHPLADIGLVGKIKHGEQVYDLYIRGKLVKKDIRPEKILLFITEGLHEIKA
jgi:sulfite reductase beta subunit-like hemoprotein